MRKRAECTQLCHSFIVNKGSPKNSLYYQGYKYCAICQKFVFTEFPKCVCCGEYLRLQPRRRSYRKDFIKDVHKLM